MEAISRNLVACAVSDANGSEVLDTLRSIQSGNVFEISSEQAEGCLTVTENTPGYENYYNWVFQYGTYLVVEPSTGMIERLTEAQFHAQYNLMKDLFLAAANDPAVLAALKAALENSP